MRIISGSAAGTILKVPKGFDVRPTPDRVKQALFNSLGNRVFNVRVLELFSGTGALGIEALSRGASHLVSVEREKRHARVIEENLNLTHMERSRFELRVQDAFAVISHLAAANRQFDLILADPPYGEKNIGKRSSSFAQRLLDDEKLPQLLLPNGILVLGHTKRDTLTLLPTWQETKLLKHGDSVIRFLARQNASGEQASPHQLSCFA